MSTGERIKPAYWRRCLEGGGVKNDCINVQLFSALNGP
jgi:hypothetical protein